MANNRYCVDLAKRGTAGCKECKVKIEKGLVRIAKILPNPFSEGAGDMKQWFHMKCIFEKLSRARATTKKIDSSDDLEGWDELDEEYKPEVLKLISEYSSSLPTKKTPAKKTPAKKTPTKASKTSSKEEEEEETQSEDLDKKPEKNDDNSFKKFWKICTTLSKHSKYTEKTAILADFFKKGSDGEGFKGHLYLWVKMLLPQVEKRVYNLQTTQIIKIFSKIFEVSQETMQEEYEEGNNSIAGDVSKTVEYFFEESNTFSPAEESTLYLQEVDKYLDQLSKTGLEVEQTNILTKVAKRCTGKDLRYFIRFIKHDLRINAGPNIVVLFNLCSYEAFQASRNLKDIVTRSMKQGKKGKDDLRVTTSLMTPVLPMLAQACKDLETPFKKYPKGFYVEVKYDGERVQIHKRGDEFNYYSRSLKPVMPHKIRHLKDFIPKAFPGGNDLMLDCEILLVDKNGLPLPFGTLGAHRQAEFKDANVCLFVFDCLQFNDENIMLKPLVERRQILEDNMEPIKNHIIVSELKEVSNYKKLEEITDSIFCQGLEGIVIKDKYGVYEPGKRHWLKLKKDYLKKDGKGMADSADLVVLGGYFGTGRKGGIMSVFLMGCRDERTKKWCTVTKVPGGDDATLDRLQKTLKMNKINKDQSQVPSWLNINKALVPDFVSADPKDSPVWEISGAEFSKAEIHTASGISIRFPRVSRVRDDKDWKTATTLKELKGLYEASKVNSEVIGLRTADDEDDEDEDQDNGEAEASNKSSTSGSSFSETPKKKSDVSEKTSRKIKKEIISTDSPKEKRKAGESDKISSKKIKMEPNQSALPEKSSKKKSSTSDTPKKIKEENNSTDSPKEKRKSEESNKESSKKIKGEGKESSESSEKGLLDIFKGVKLHIPADTDKAEELTRYFIAYDGELLRDHEISESTHAICSTKDKTSAVSKSAKQVTVDWLWDSIKLRKLLPTREYKPK
ncbi:hypothetical protein JTE90_021375 [Oedothorax gibbosus]|uniref:DNA ligase n=1 Tax=Oedothorax gibbosus TaxID=931172 RepID=A0AAV6VDY2_9ARAC|nr:hypothetical protein JTE90_021375 [Oedothorax gibbosus]